MGFVLLPEAIRRRIRSARKSFKEMKEKRDSGVFVLVLLSVLDSRTYLNTSPHGQMLLLDLLTQNKVTKTAICAWPRSSCCLVAGDPRTPFQLYCFNKPLYIKTIKIISETILWVT